MHCWCSFVGQLTSQASKKAGTTNLHVDVSDAVNVLVYVGVGGHGDDGLDKADEIQREILSYRMRHNDSSSPSCRSRSGDSWFESGWSSIATVEKRRTAWCSLAFVSRWWCEENSWLSRSGRSSSRVPFVHFASDSARLDAKVPALIPSMIKRLI